MIPFAARHVSTEERELFNKIFKVINELPEIDLGVDEYERKIELSCHILARATAKVFSQKYEDGYYFPNHPHSWIRTQDGHLIDVYPVATIGGPILIVEGINSPIRWQYEKTSANDISQGNFSRSSFRRSVRRVEEEIKKIVQL